MVRMSDLARGGQPPAPVRPGPPAVTGTTEPAATETEPAATSVAAPPAPPERPRATSLYSQILSAREPSGTVMPVAAAAPAALATAPVSPTPAVAVETPERLLNGLREFCERLPDLFRSSEPFPWGALQRLVEGVVSSLEAGPELFWLANTATALKGADHLAVHQTRVTIMALRIGMTIGLDRPRLVTLGMAAALSGIGLGQLPAGVLRRLDALTPDEEAQHQAHPRVAAERIRRWGPPVEGLVEIVLQHQEREQGQGFPQGLPGPAIRIEAKIIGLADTYMALTAPPPQRPGLRPHEGVREIVRSKHEAFPPLLVKALLNDITVFPPGTTVRLNTGEIGSVVAVNRNHPLRPRVQIADGRMGPLRTPKIVDLSEAPFLYITGPVTETVR
jgi:HD-GYP domain-containing protein (c-di-GMP phosphodiesterase class II)